ncbi:TRAP transporter small permease [Brevibacterium spongiae]|uniref:TRAP transporter small permease n=1 Tax=Brevibacterium spongiae TaxID=2909672 RepID=A0ABY5SUE1_9MICO|nr:TRAP transporter small permease [Brevibacterium spongiae]UVI36684.1 TRAP transporter small permease [Brevibacterium spongiae]
MKKKLQATAKWLLAAQRWILFICCALVVVGLFAQVILRYVLGTTILGLNELILIPTIWMYFIGASYASAEGTHISADVLQAYLRSERTKQIVQVIVSAISLAVGLILSWWACLYIQHSLDRPGTTPVFALPLIIVQSAVIVGFILMTMYTAANLYVAIAKLKDSQAPSSPKHTGTALDHESEG